MHDTHDTSSDTREGAGSTPDCSPLFGSHSADRVTLYAGSAPLSICGRHAAYLSPADHQTLAAANLARCIGLLVADANASDWDDIHTPADAVAHARDTLRLPEEAPAPGAYPLTDDGSPEYFAYRAVLMATPEALAVALASPDLPPINGAR